MAGAWPEDDGFGVPSCPCWNSAADYRLFTHFRWVGTIFVHVPLLISLALGTITGSIFNFVAYRILWSKNSAAETP